MSQTCFRTICPNTVLLFELGWDILLYELIANLENTWKIKNKSEKSLGPSKIQFYHFFFQCAFFFVGRASLVPTFLLAGGYRKWNPFACISVIPHCIRKIHFEQIWTYGTSPKIDYRHLKVQICCRPLFSKFFRNRITLRVGMWHPALRVTS